MHSANPIQCFFMFLTLSNLAALPRADRPISSTLRRSTQTAVICPTKVNPSTLPDVILDILLDEVATGVAEVGEVEDEEVAEGATRLQSRRRSSSSSRVSKLTPPPNNNPGLTRVRPMPSRPAAQNEQVFLGVSASPNNANGSGNGGRGNNKKGRSTFNKLQSVVKKVAVGKAFSKKVRGCEDIYMRLCHRSAFFYN